MGEMCFSRCGEVVRVLWFGGSLLHWEGIWWLQHACDSRGVEVRIHMCS